jgi:hypothetical protein
MTCQGIPVLGYDVRLSAFAEARSTFLTIVTPGKD